MAQKLPVGAVLHTQGYRDPIDGTLRLAVTACGQQIVPGTWVTNDAKQLGCEGCKKVLK